ncbi:MAG: phosphoenolpyruvate carboxykinase (GTP) [Fibrobacteria bacterium]|nr:phosphoenolpyruvate carboxykinase (GTP) [Fibrobacteria bacterium]
MNYEELLKSKMDSISYEKLTKLNNQKLFDFVGYYVNLCEPDTVYMCDDSEEDANYIRQKSLEIGEEVKLAKPNQTMHYDGYGDQGRDKDGTKFMVPADQYEAMKHLNAIVYEEGLKEIEDIAKGSMKGKQAIVKLFCEGPTHSHFSRPCAQITDSYYVCHSEEMLYRRAYQHFVDMEDKNDFYRFVHSAGELDELGCVANLDKRRIFMDCENNIVYSMNAQYAGNSVGLKKHSMRLAINESGKQNWLCEHMFVMNIPNEEKKRDTYFCGAFPSACGKTATAMLPGEKIIGDDIAYFRNVNGEFRAVNVERGIFGIIQDVNSKDDPVIWNTLHEDKEMIFSNVLTGPDNEPYWQGMNMDTPKEGTNHSGPGWKEGKKDAKGKEIPLAHPNSRYTIRMEYLDNIDMAFNNKDGVLVGGVVYGGRDSDTSVPVEESFSWDDGIAIKACTLESETTSATLGKEGVRVPCMMANLDFISYPIGEYIQNNLDFVKDMKNVPPVFCVNYFLKNREGDFCTSKLAKKVWMHWAEKRVHKEVGAHKTPLGFIPKLEDIQPMFTELLGETYTDADYQEQFQFRCDAWLQKLDRIVEYYNTKWPDCPKSVFEKWENAKATITAAKEKYGAFIAPGTYQE